VTSATPRVVVADADLPSDPTHGYTVGLPDRLGHAELLLVGLPAEPTRDFLTHAIEVIGRGGRFAHGDLTDALFPQAIAAIRRVGEQHVEAYLTDALAHHGGADFAALQIVFPDRMGRYPWDEGADLRMRLVQPVLDGKFRKCRYSCG
jgi:hypothetical protein